MDRTTPLIWLQVQLPGKAKTRASLETGDGVSRILSLVFKDSEKGADVANLEINNYDQTFPDNPLFDRGNLLFLKWGYAEVQSRERQCVIRDWTPGPTFKVEAVSTAILMNRERKDQTYYGLKFSQIAALIAKRNGYGAAVQDIDDTGDVIEFVPQPNWTDAQLLTWMTKRLHWIWYVDEAGFHMHPRRTSGKPRKTLAWFANGLGDMKAYPSFQKMPAAAAGAVTVAGIDKATGKPYSVRADNASTKGRPGIAPVVEVFDRKTGASKLQTQISTEQVLASSAANASQAKAIAAGAYARHQQNPIRGTVPIVGDPLLEARDLLTFTGLNQRLSGNYYAVELTTTIKPGQYDIMLTFNRDGLSGAGAGTTVHSDAKTNTTAGPPAKTTSDELQEVEVHDARTGETRIEYHPKKAS